MTHWLHAGKMRAEPLQAATAARLRDRQRRAELRSRADVERPRHSRPAVRGRLSPGLRT